MEWSARLSTKKDVIAYSLSDKNGKIHVFFVYNCDFIKSHFFLTCIAKIRKIQLNVFMK